MVSGISMITGFGFNFQSPGIFHDFYCQFGKTKIFVYRKPEGFGLVCHRAIKTVCEVLGIKDLYAKCEGSPNTQHVIKAFFLGLLNQKRYDQMAESKGLHLVEFRKEFGDFPKVVASPTKCRTEEDIRHDEIMDYTQVRTRHFTFNWRSKYRVEL